MSIKSEVLTALMEREGKNVTAEQLAKVTGWEEDQVAASANHIAKNPDLGVTRVASKVFRYSSESKAPAPEAQQETLALRIVATLPEGWSIGLDQQSGKAYRVEKM